MDDEVRRLLMTYLHRPVYGLVTEADIYKRACENCACQELLFRIMDHPFDDPIRIIEGFSYEMLLDGIRSNDGDLNGFIIANELANEILLQFEHPKE